MHDGLLLNMAQTVLHVRVALRNCTAQNEVIPIIPNDAFYGPNTCALE